MIKEYRFLLLEDSLTDAEFIKYHLQKEGIRCTTLRVDTEKDFVNAIRDFKPDIILSDYNLPAYDGLAALNYVHSTVPDIPVIVVSGAIGEEKAVELLRLGARDYILKDRLNRLPSAIKRVIKEQEEINIRKEMEQKLHESEERLRNILDTALDAFITIDSEGVITNWNREAEKLFGYQSNETVGKSLAELIIPPQYREPHSQGLKHYLETGEGKILGHRIEITAIKKDQSEFPVELSVTAVQHGNETFFSAFVRDITENKTAADALRKSEARHRLLVENSPMCIHEIDLEGKVISMNKAGLDMIGFKDENEVKGIEYIQWVHNEEKPRIQGLMLEAFSGRTGHFEFKASGKHLQYFKSSFVPIKNKNGQVEKLMGITEDITRRKLEADALQESESHFRRLADYDPLTKLPNRRLLNDRISQAMIGSKRSGRYGALLFLDLDNFKPLNDSHGHNIGDLLLIEVARRINSCIREVDTVSRFGGDEFVVMLTELDKEKEASKKISKSIAEKIRVSLSEPYNLVIVSESNETSNLVHNSTASIGAVLFINHNHTPEDLLKWADLAMYKSKAEGRNRISYFDIEKLDIEP